MQNVVYEVHHEIACSFAAAATTLVTPLSPNTYYTVVCQLLNTTVRQGNYRCAWPWLVLLMGHSQSPCPKNHCPVLIVFQRHPFLHLSRRDLPRAAVQWRPEQQQPRRKRTTECSADTGMASVPVVGPLCVFSHWLSVQVSNLQTTFAAQLATVTKSLAQGIDVHYQSHITCE